MYFSDVKGGTAVYKTDLEGKTTEFIKNAPGISGLQRGSDGRLYACVAREQRVVVFDKDGNETELANEILSSENEDPRCAVFRRTGRERTDAEVRPNRPQ